MSFCDLLVNEVASFFLSPKRIHRRIALLELESGYSSIDEENDLLSSAQDRFSWLVFREDAYGFIVHVVFLASDVLQLINVR